MPSDHPVQSALQHLLIESQDSRGAGTACRFLRSARHLPAGRTVVFLVDDGVGSAVGDQPDVACLLDAGGTVWADEASLAAHGISDRGLVPGVAAVGINRIAPLLADPAVRVVWH